MGNSIFHDESDGSNRFTLNSWRSTTSSCCMRPNLWAFWYVIFCWLRLLIRPFNSLSKTNSHTKIIFANTHWKMTKNEPFQQQPIISINFLSKRARLCTYFLYQHGAEMVAPGMIQVNGWSWNQFWKRLIYTNDFGTGEITIWLSHVVTMSSILPS